MEPHHPAPYVYILGGSHSGSTLLELLLGAHPQLVPIGEIDKLSLQFARGDRLCSCRAYPTECPVWTTVTQAVKERYGVDLREQPFAFRVSDIGWEEDCGWRATGHWLAHKSSRLWRYMAYRHIPIMRHMIALSRFHHRWAERRLFVADFIRQFHNASGVIDSSKDYLGVRDLEVTLGDELKTIFLTRNVYGSVWSTMKANPSVTLEQASHQWVKVNARSLRMLQHVSKNYWIHLKYEELCNHLEDSLKQLCRFLGYDFDPIMYDLSPYHHHTIAGNKIRIEAIGHIQEDMSWKQNLSATDVRRIDRIASYMSVQLGYAYAD